MIGQKLTIPLSDLVRFSQKRINASIQLMRSETTIPEYIDEVAMLESTIEPYVNRVEGPGGLYEVLQEAYGPDIAGMRIKNEQRFLRINRGYGLETEWGYYVVSSEEISDHEFVIVPFLSVDADSKEKIKDWGRERIMGYLNVRYNMNTPIAPDFFIKNNEGPYLH